MKVLRLMLAFGLLAGITSCANPGGGRNNMDADSLFSDSVARDSATWGDTIDDTTRVTDSLASPSFP